MPAQQLLKEVHGIFAANLLQYVYKIDRKYKHCFKDPEPGIYIVNRIDPIIPIDTKVYTRKSLVENKPFHVLAGIDEDIVDANGKVIIPAYVMERKKRFLSTEPNLPSRAIKVLYLIIQEYVDSLLVYTDPVDFESKIKEHLTDEGMTLYREGYFEGAAHKIISEISMFIGMNIWNFYFFELKNTDIYITRSCDYRVYDWTLIQEERREIQRRKEEDAVNT